MKYLITESQLDKVIFKYLNNQDFIQIEKNNRIYFAYSENDEYAQIRFDKDDGTIITKKKRAVKKESELPTSPKSKPIAIKDN